MNKLEQSEIEFQNAMKDWTDESKDQQSRDKAWDKMSLLVMDCCSNIAKKVCGKFRDEVEDIAMSGYYYCMDCIERLNLRPRSLKAFCYLRTSRFFTEPRKHFNDTIIPDSYTEDPETHSTALSEVVYMEEERDCKLLKFINQLYKEETRNGDSIKNIYTNAPESQYNDGQKAIYNALLDISSYGGIDYATLVEEYAQSVSHEGILKTIHNLGLKYE